MAFTQVLPVQDRSGTARTGAIAWPAGATQVQARLDLTPFAGRANPFNDPALQIIVGADLSYDGGATWFEACHATFQGSASGVWGRFPACYLGCRPPSDHLPTHGRAWYTVGDGQTVTFGVSVQVE